MRRFQSGRWHADIQARPKENPGAHADGSTVRYAIELGYEVTMIKDATAAFSADEMHAALDVNLQNYASPRSFLGHSFRVCQGDSYGGDSPGGVHWK